MEQRFANTRTVSTEFEDWAKGLSGIPGGNPEGDLWFCGIEYGGTSQDADLLYKPNIDPALSKYPFWTRKFKDTFKDYTKWQFNQKQAKIAFAYLNDGSLDGWRDYLRHEFYSHNGHTFGMNLYPMSFPDTDDRHWTMGHYKKVGFLSKAEYKGWCSQHRFPMLRKRVEEFSPKALVCTGNTFTRAFLIAFADTVDQVFDPDALQTKSLEGNKEVGVAKINDGKTLLVITPFLGPGGLMSDASLVDLGNLIRREVGY